MTHLTTILEKPQTILIVTGLSGAGKTSVMGALEDLDFYCVDNLPLPLLPTLLNLVQKTPRAFLKVALGIDARGEQFLHHFTQVIKELKEAENSRDIKIIFLNAQEQTLLKRFQETRRKHPLVQGINLDSAIKQEKMLMEPIMHMADIILDTDVFTIHGLRHWIRQSFSDVKKQTVFANIVSFGFKHGVPQEINLVYDLRFLPNPHFIPDLRKLTGKDKMVSDYVFGQPSAIDYWDRLTNFLQFCLQKYHEEGRFFVTIGIGCTGGKHRSVAFVEKLSQEKWDHVTFLVHHRDVSKE